MKFKDTDLLNYQSMIYTSIIGQMYDLKEIALVRCNLDSFFPKAEMLTKVTKISLEGNKL